MNTQARENAPAKWSGRTRGRGWIPLLAWLVTAYLVLSCNRQGPPGVLEPYMREDFAGDWTIEWLKESKIQTHKGGKNKTPSWSLMVKRK